LNELEKGFHHWQPFLPAAAAFWVPKRVGPGRSALAVGAAEAVQGLLQAVADGVGVGVVVVGVVIGQGEVVADLLGERREVARGRR
jgi:hypothetical protein